MKRTKILLRSESGQALGEVAVVSTMLLLLLFGCIAAGQYAYDAILVGNGSRAGVQYGSQKLATAGDTTGIQAAVHNDVVPLAVPSPTSTTYCTCAQNPATPLVTPPASTCLKTDCPLSYRITYVRVTTSATFKPAIAFPGVPGSASINARTDMQVLSP